MIAKQTLRECNVFRSLASEDIEKIESMAVGREYEPGDVIFQQGDAAEEIFVIQEGKVAVQMQVSGVPPPMSKSVTVDIVTNNDVLGWSAIVEPYVYTLTGVCLQRAKVLAIKGMWMRSLAQHNRDIGYEILNGLIKVVASRLDDTRRLLISERLWTPKLK